MIIMSRKGLMMLMMISSSTPSKSRAYRKLEKGCQCHFARDDDDDDDDDDAAADGIMRGEVLLTLASLQSQTHYRVKGMPSQTALYHCHH